MCIEERNFRPIRRESENRADSFLYFFREAAEMAHFTVYNPTLAVPSYPAL
jgi:hypothetical protein